MDVHSVSATDKYKVPNLPPTNSNRPDEFFPTNVTLLGVPQATPNGRRGKERRAQGDNWERAGSDRTSVSCTINQENLHPLASLQT